MARDAGGARADILAREPRAAPLPWRWPVMVVAVVPALPDVETWLRSRAAADWPREWVGDGPLEEDLTPLAAALDGSAAHQSRTALALEKSDAVLRATRPYNRLAVILLRT